MKIQRKPRFTNREDEGTTIIYVSALISRESFAQYFGTGKKVPSIAAQKFHRLLVEGLAADPRVADVVVVGAPPVSRAVSEKLMHARRETDQGDVRFIGLPFINAPVLRQVAILVGTMLEVLRESRAQNAVIVCDVLCGAPSLGALAMGALTRRPVLGVVTDVPRRRPRVGGVVHRTITHAVGWAGATWLGAFDGYLLLTEPMNQAVNRHQRPYTVIEGLVDTPENTLAYEACDGGAHVVLYTGSTHRVYGLPMLVEAFRSADLAGWELHVCGSGDYDKDMLRVASQDPRIKFFGVVDNDEAVQRQLHADVLINPRPTDAEFTKYSFPSKNMEYMASGRPLLTTKLPGMPDDYLPHVLLLPDESVAGYTSALQEVAATNPRELDRLGAAARDFVLVHKNKNAQATKFLDLVKDIQSDWGH